MDKITPSGKMELAGSVLGGVAGFYAAKLVEKLFDELFVQGKLHSVIRGVTRRS